LRCGRDPVRTAEGTAETRDWQGANSCTGRKKAGLFCDREEPMRNTDPDHARHPLIVLVEEETMEREVFTEYLESTGFAVLDAADTDRGLALLEANGGVRGLVTDAHVPGQIDGCELAQVACARWPRLAVVMMSGHSDA